MKISESSRKHGNMRFRGKDFLRGAARWVLVAQLAGFSMPSAAGDNSGSKPAPESGTSDPVLKAMQAETAPPTAEPGKMEQPPYYLGYTGYDQAFVALLR